MFKTYTCPLSKNLIEFHIENNIATTGYMTLENKNVKLFFLLLQKSVSELKLANIIKVRQYVSVTDWHDFLKENNKWSLLESNSETCTIECHIDNALYCISKGFGLSETNNI